MHMPRKDEEERALRQGTFLQPLRGNNNNTQALSEKTSLVHGATPQGSPTCASPLMERERQTNPLETSK